MFVEHKEQGEAAPVKVGTLKLSEAIRECGYGNPSDPTDCVLGRAYERFTGHPTNKRAGHGNLHPGSYQEQVSRLFKVPLSIAVAAEMMCMSKKSHIAIADYVESQGY